MKLKKRQLRKMLKDYREREAIYRERIEHAQSERADILEAAMMAAKLAEERIARLESELQAAQGSARKTRELGIAGLLVMADALGVRVAQGDPTLGDGGQGRSLFERSAASVDRAGGTRRCEECGIVGGHKTSCSQQFARVVEEDREEDTEYMTEGSGREHARAVEEARELDEHAMAADREQRRGGGLAVTEEGE